MEVVVDALADVEGDGFDRGDVVDEALDEVLGGVGDLDDRVEVVVGEVLLVHREGGRGLDRRAIGQRDLSTPVECGRYAGLGELPADVVAGDRLGAVRPGVVHDTVTDLFVLFFGEAVHCEARRVGLQAVRVALEHLVRPQSLQRVEADEQRHVGEALQEWPVDGVTVDERLRDPEHQRGVREPGAHRDPVVGLGTGSPVLGDDGDDLAAALHDLVEPVGVGHLVLDEVLPDHDDEAAVAHVVHVDLGRLETVHERETRGLVAAPRVLRPVAGALRFLFVDASDVRIEQRQRVGEAEEPELARHAVDGQGRSELHRADARLLPVLEHLGLVAVLVEQALLAFLAAVGLRDGHEAARDVVVGLLPGDPDELVVTPGVEAVLRTQIRVVGQGREAVVGPFLPSLAQHRVLRPVRAVDPTVQRVALGAAPWVPGHRGAVALRVAVVPAVVVLLDPGDHAVATERPQPAHVGVVGCADEREGIVVGVQVPVHLLPVAVRVLEQRVVDALGGAQERQALEAPRGAADENGTAGELQEGAPGDSRG